MKVEIYSKDDCSYCSMAIKIAELNKHEVLVKKLEVDFSREELLEKFPSARSFPQIVVDGKYVGGYQEFTRFLHASKQDYNKD